MELPGSPVVRKQPKVDESHSGGCPQLVAGYELIRLRAVFNKKLPAACFQLLAGTLSTRHKSVSDIKVDESRFGLIAATVFLLERCMCSQFTYTKPCRKEVKGISATATLSCRIKHVCDDVMHIVVSIVPRYNTAFTEWK